MRLGISRRLSAQPPRRISLGVAGLAIALAGACGRPDAIEPSAPMAMPERYEVVLEGSPSATGDEWRDLILLIASCGEATRPQRWGRWCSAPLM